MASEFSDVVTALIAISDIASYIASAERSFSKLRLIKSYTNVAQWRRTDCEVCHCCRAYVSVYYYTHAALKRKMCNIKFLR